VLLHSRLHVLLSVANIFFTGFETGCLVHYDRRAATTAVGAGLLVPAVALECLEVFGSDAVVELGI
jgi:hypothetical protein